MKEEDSPLRKMRKKHGFTLEDVAKKIGLHKTTICKIEKNQQRMSISSSLKLAELYKITVDTLLKMVEH